MSRMRFNEARMREMRMLENQREMEQKAARERAFIDMKNEYQINELSQNVNAKLDDIHREVKPEKTYQRNQDAFWEGESRFSKYDNDGGEDDW